MFEWLVDPEAWISLLTLTALEIVLGIDNIIFISILVGRLPANQRQSGRIIGLGLAMITRILLLVSLSWMMKLTEPLFTLVGQEISGRDLILFLGGLFLIGKSIGEIQEESQLLGRVNPNCCFRYCVFFRLRDYGSRYGKPSSSDDFSDYACGWCHDVCGETNW